MTTDKLGRRSILLPCQTILCVVLFIVGGLDWSGATSGNVSAGTALVSPFRHLQRLLHSTNHENAQLAICCLWTFSFQVIAMSQYVFSAELPSAILRSKFCAMSVSGRN